MFTDTNWVDNRFVLVLKWFSSSVEWGCARQILSPVNYQVRCDHRDELHPVHIHGNENETWSKRRPSVTFCENKKSPNGRQRRGGTNECHFDTVWVVITWVLCSTVQSSNQVCSSFRLRYAECEPGIRIEIISSKEWSCARWILGLVNYQLRNEHYHVFSRFISSEELNKVNLTKDFTIVNSLLGSLKFS